MVAVAACLAYTELSHTLHEHWAAAAAAAVATANQEFLGNRIFSFGFGRLENCRNKSSVPCEIKGSRFGFDVCHYCALVDNEIKAVGMKQLWKFIFVLFGHKTKRIHTNENAMRTQFHRLKNWGESTWALRDREIECGDGSERKRERMRISESIYAKQNIYTSKSQQTYSSSFICIMLSAHEMCWQS